MMDSNQISQQLPVNHKTFIEIISSYPILKGTYRESSMLTVLVLTIGAFFMS